MTTWHLKIISACKLAKLRQKYLSESNSIIEMLSQTLLTIMVNVDGDRINEILFNDILLDHFIGYLTGPSRRGSNIFAYTCSHVRARLTELTSSPHVSIAEEELSPFNFGGNYGRLDSHLGKMI